MQVNPSNLLNTWVNSIPSFECDPAMNIYYNEKYGYGLQLKDYVKDRASEKSVLTIPKHLVLCASRIKELAKSDETLNSWIEVDNCTGTNLLHRGMLYYWLKAENSEWKDYLHSLPTKIDLPFSYNIRKMECLHFSTVSLNHASMSKRLEIERLYERFVASNVTEPNSISLEQWLLPYQWISSRGLKHPIRDETCIVPLIDLCNHSSKKKNARYDLDEKGNFQLLLLPTDLPAPRGASPTETFDLLIDYGTRSSGEFMFNYGFVPDDRTIDDFDEIVRFFDPSCDHIRNILDPGRAISDATDDERYAWSLAYDVLLEFFSKNMPQALRIVVLPKSIEPSDQNRFRFHNHFIMALASDEYLELVSDDDKDELYLNDTRLRPNRVFEAVQALKDKAVLQKAREIVAKLCRLFYNDVSRVADSDAAISKLAMVEASIYKRYAEVIESVVVPPNTLDSANFSKESEPKAFSASSIPNCLKES